MTRAAPKSDAIPDVSVVRLAILRAYYALMAFGTAAVFWPDLISHTDEWGMRAGAQYSLLGAITPLALLGLRHPLKMLPVVLYEFVWKALWFVFVAAPLWSHGRMTQDVWADVFACGIAIVLTPVVVPWRYVRQVYLVAPADRWR